MRILTGLLFIGLLLGCGNGIKYSEYVSLPDGWQTHQPIAFHLETQDTVTKKNLFIMIRNDARYELSNLFIVTKMEIPHNNKVIVGTLEYEMATPEGKWLGDGYSAVKENKLWYKEQFTFPAKGSYSIKIEQAMRRIGKNNGVQQFKDITEIGSRVEESEKQRKRESI